ncbi:MAG: hypothetical protein ACFFD9_09455 [Candidatus Thorarchaeota archaeon]
MRPPTLFTWRMAKSELDTWLSIQGAAKHDSIEYAKSLMDLPDGTFFLASIANQVVGGTAIYKDRTRLAVALMAARMLPEFRENAQLQLLRSSIPFFRTVVIHEVDVLVSLEREESPLPFPFNSEVSSSLTPALGSLEFQDVTTALSCTIEIPTETPAMSDRISWDARSNMEGARDLYWRQIESSRLDCSQVTLALEFGAYRGFLRTLTMGELTILALGFELMEDRVVVWPLLADLEHVNPQEIAHEVLSQASDFEVQRVEIPLLGLGQKDIAETVAVLGEGRLRTREIVLMRKQL